jgi:acyl-CoA thioesterase-1
MGSIISSFMNSRGGRFGFSTMMLVLAGVFTLVACTASPRLAALPPDAVVLAFGDSITYGTGASPDESYPAVLARLTGRTVINAGVPGEVTAEGLARLPGTLEKYHPALMILCLGGNDFLRRLDERQAADNLRGMVKLAREKGVAVVLLGEPKLGLDPAPPAWYREIAREFDAPYEGKALQRILTKKALKSDYIHPNAEGYRVLAEGIAALLKKSGAL